MPMLAFTFYAAFPGTFLSITILTYIAWKEHHPDHPQSLSAFVAQRKQLVNWFRIVTVVVSSLFAVTIYFFHRAQNTVWGCLVCRVDYMLRFRPALSPIPRKRNDRETATQFLCLHDGFGFYFDGRHIYF